MLSATSFSRPKHNLEKNVTPPTDKITNSCTLLYPLVYTNSFNSLMNSLLNSLIRNRE